MRNPAFLRQRFLIRLQPREKFDATKNALGDLGGEFPSRRNDAIEPEADFGGFAAHLQMDVARSGAFGQEHEIFQNLRRGDSGSPCIFRPHIFFRHEGFIHFRR